MNAKTLFLPALASALLLVASAAAAQENGDAARGRDLAKRNCSGCHGTEADDVRSPLAKAPTFKAVADTAGMSPFALMAWFRGPHKSMPDFIVASGDVRDLAAYILSLKTPQ